MKKSINMLEGSLWDKILVFAIPLAVTGILQQLFNATDVAIIGQFVGADAMAAVGANTSVVTLLVSLFLGVSIGTNVVMAKYTGMGDMERVEKTMHTSIAFALVGGLFLTIVGQFVAEPILRLMSVPDNILPMAVLYLRIYLVGMPFNFLYNFESAIFRSQGDTKTPLLCLIASGIINVCLNLLFVLKLGRSVDGVAMATVTAMAVSSLLMFFMLLRRNDALKVSLIKIRIRPRYLSEVVRIGLPAGVQGMVFSLSNLCVQQGINSLGSDAIAASTAALYIEILVYFLVNSFGQAATTFIGQNYGAGKLDRCKRVTLTCVVMGIVVAEALAVVLYLFGGSLLQLFNSDAAVIALGMQRLRMVVLFEGVNAVIEILSGTMRGYGYSMVPAFVAFFGICGVRIVYVYTVFRMHPTFIWLMAAYPISWLITTLLLILAYVVFQNKTLKKRSYC